MRTTFCSLLQVVGTSPKVAQELMRHSDPRLTMTTYTDVKLLDVAGPVNAVAAVLSFDPTEPVEHRATGTEGVHHPFTKPLHQRLHQLQGIRVYSVPSREFG